jgi:hypothetical protein
MRKYIQNKQFKHTFVPREALVPCSTREEAHTPIIKTTKSLFSSAPTTYFNLFEPHAFIVVSEFVELDKLANIIKNPHQRQIVNEMCDMIYVFNLGDANETNIKFNVAKNKIVFIDVEPIFGKLHFSYTNEDKSFFKQYPATINMFESHSLSLTPKFAFQSLQKYFKNP